MFSFSECKKETTVVQPVIPQTYPIVGLWNGTQIAPDGSAIDTLFYSFTIQPDNTLQVVGMGGDGTTYYSAGKWALSGTSFTGLITVTNFSQAGVQQTLSATYDSTAGTLSAGVVKTVNVNFTGSFSLTRIN